MATEQLGRAMPVSLYGDRGRPYWHGILGRFRHSKPRQTILLTPKEKSSHWEKAAATWEALAWILCVCPVAHAEWQSLGQGTQIALLT